MHGGTNFSLKTCDTWRPLHWPLNYCSILHMCVHVMYSHIQAFGYPNTRNIVYTVHVFHSTVCTMLDIKSDGQRTLKCNLGVMRIIASVHGRFSTIISQ